MQMKKQLALAGLALVLCGCQADKSSTHVWLTSSSGARFAEEAPVVFRRVGQARTEGNRVVVEVNDRRQSIDGFGNSVTESSVFVLACVPEEERHETFIAIYTDFALSLGADRGSTYTGPDRIYWNGETWRVVRVRDWAMFGYYQALAVMMHE